MVHSATQFAGGEELVNFQLSRIAHRLRNQYQLKVESRLKGKAELQRMSLKVVNGGGIQIFAPQRVNVSNPSAD